MRAHPGGARVHEALEDRPRLGELLGDARLELAGDALMHHRQGQPHEQRDDADREGQHLAAEAQTEAHQNVKLTLAVPEAGTVTLRSWYP